MTIITTSTYFFLGNFADLDTDESDWDNENPNAVLGNHDTLSFVDVDNHDTDEDGAIFDDDAGNGTSDFISYDTGSGATSSTLDSTSLYNAEVLLGDGTILTTTVVILQAANGDVFLSDYQDTSLDNLKIQSINLTSEHSSNYAGFQTGEGIENSEVVCFATGTRVKTPSGLVSVEKLRPGMQVCTLDNGDQPILWTNSSHTPRGDKNAQIIFATGSLGAGLPQRTLRLSPQHRVLLGSRIVERMMGVPQALAAAKHLRDLKGVRQNPGFLPVSYHHFACRNHEIIFAEGMAVETFYAGSQARKSLSDIARKRLMRSIPELRKTKVPKAARTFISKSKSQQLVARHIKNGHSLIEFCQPLTLV